MCINAETSLGALLLGIFTGTILIIDQESNKLDYEKILIGIFVIFFSLIQLFEYKIYLNKHEQNIIYKNLLLLNLGFQGLVFFILMSFIYKINGIYLLICGLTSFIIIIEIIINQVEITLNETKCVNWDFMSNNNHISKLLFIMYFVMFFWIFVEPNSNYLKYIGYIFLSTLIFSYFIQDYKINKPSIWCLTSAIAAPFFLLY